MLWLWILTGVLLAAAAALLGAAGFFFWFSIRRRKSERTSFAGRTPVSAPQSGGASRASKKALISS